ncbi:MAG: serine hydrolase [Bacteroidales bacterium]|nr:serine hydrolase [Bacteroidales bacterium]
MKKAYLYFSLIAAIILYSCEKNKDVSYEYSAPENIGDGLEVSTLSVEELDENKFIEMMEALRSDPLHRIHSILVLKNGKLVFEEYFEGYALSHDPFGADGAIMTYNRDTDHYLASISKSITSALVGLAIDHGYIGSVNDKISVYLPEYSDVFTGEKTEISIEHMLTMRSGLPWDEHTYPIGHPLNDHTPLFNSEDPIRWVLERPMEYSPGERFVYNSGTTNVLAAIVEESSGYSLDEFLDHYLLNPLGIFNADYIFQIFSNGRFFASGGMFMSARELCKIGLVYLDNGRWKGNQIISSEWIQESQKERITFSGTHPFIDSYGYQWWRNTFEVQQKEYFAYFGLGWGEQVLFIFPGLDMIVQFYCGYFQTEPEVYPANLVEEYILPALISN